MSIVDFKKKKKYSVSWIALIGEGQKHIHKTITHVDEFANLEEALEWAKARLSIEVQECDDEGKTIPLLNNKLKRPVERSVWIPEE
jgi:hypothetical protein